MTGADGFIGSHLVEKLVTDGASVRAFVMYNSLGYRGWLDFIPDRIADQIEFFAGDVRDPFRVRNALEGIDTVFHLASLIAIPYSYQAAKSYVATNVTGTLNLLQAARDAGVSRFVHTSTSEVYGTAQYVPIDEKHPLVGQSPYAASKIGADQMAQSFYTSFALPVATIRPFNTYGPRQSARAVIPAIICQIAAGHSEIKLGSLTPTRDFTFVADIADAFVALAECDEAVGETTNIGSGREISIGDLARTISELMGVNTSVVCDNERVRPVNSEVDRLMCDNAKASRLAELVATRVA